ncbi:SSI family serine proteinase inhibitor [Streptomyces fractus]|uniref:SSI family serine proteinase inhibitor n=1 Tax=Streptomyces fractus TaxID=641806 RepID=UPI003CE6E251
MATTTAIKLRAALLAPVLAAALLGAGASTVQAYAPDAGKTHDNWMYVAVAEHDAKPGELTERVLKCGKWFTDVKVYRACKQLAKADGDIGKIPAETKACSKEYKPVTALAYGKWNGRNVAYTKIFPNECVMHATTRAVFKAL